MRSRAPAPYDDLVRRVRAAIERTVPIGATVAIVTKGDEQFLQLRDRFGWHFPRREGGAYSGYYPIDSSAAIAHLESLKKKGAQYIVFPQTSFWWLEHYAPFAQHLERKYAAAKHVEGACIIYSINGSADIAAQKLSSSAGVDLKAIECDARSESTARRRRASRSINDPLPPSILKGLHQLFDLKYYQTQAGMFSSIDKAIDHYLRLGFKKQFTPNPLFDPIYYSKEYREVSDSRDNPLLHFLSEASSGLHNPNPYFDTDFYYSQEPRLRRDGANALAHYIAHCKTRSAARPNPLFDDAFYLDNYPDVRSIKQSPLSHFLTSGCGAGRFASLTHKNIKSILFGTTGKNLLRGNWARGAVLLFASHANPAEAEQIVNLAEELQRFYRLKCPTIFFDQSAPGSVDGKQNVKHVNLDDFHLACDIFRTSALRLLVRSFKAGSPLFAISATAPATDALRAEGIPCITPTSEVARHMRNGASAKSILWRAQRDRLLPHGFIRSALNRSPLISKSSPTRKIIIPCSDWAVSGVNSAIESIGGQLIRLGWDVKIVFTRDSKTVADSCGGKRQFPSVPYQFLPVKRDGLGSMWEALIVHLETHAPCIMLMAYDFAANAVVPALTEKIGVVAWVQSNDRDYYEQTYRLARYCNAVVCVSNRIRERVAELNPSIGRIARVIHNSSISRKEIRPGSRRRRRGPIMRMIYTGRIVQYQKRVFDFIRLADAMYARRMPFEITLIGEFDRQEQIEDRFRAAARDHLAAGRIELPGRMKRDRILKELTESDFFVLLSDFEGLPLSLIEAMSCGCVPVVAETDSGIPDAVTNEVDGLIMPGRDYDSWAKSLDQWWQDAPALNRLSSQAKQTVHDRFTVEHIGRQFSDLFEQVARQIHDGTFQRPECLNCGAERSPAGDVLPPPSLVGAL